MGNKSRRLHQFLTNHPKCCYCGGDTPATTEDHWPPRTVFVGRAWPEGYVFPACASCQIYTSNVEGLFGMICRLAPQNQAMDGRALAELEKQARGQAVRHPELMQSLMLASREKRTVLRNRNARPEPGQLIRDVPILTLRHPEVQRIIETCFQKLLLSLHYFHTGTALPRQGVAFLRWFSNGDPTSTDAFDEVSTKLPHQVQRKRGKVDLSDQFAYRFTISNDNSTSAFLAVFGESLAVLGFLCNDRSQISEATKGWKVEFGPLDPSATTRMR